MFFPRHNNVITPYDIPDTTPLFTPLYTIHLSFYRGVTRVHRVTVPESPRRETVRCCTRSTLPLLTRRVPALMPRLVAQVVERRTIMLLECFIIKSYKSFFVSVSTKLCHGLYHKWVWVT